MDWISEFYAFQEDLTKVYTQPIQDHHASKADLLTIKPNAHILELGAGGAQVSAVLAARGHSLTAVDLNPAAVQHAHTLAKTIALPGSLTPLQGDFYTLELPQKSFDALCYFDGFGIGTDADQRRLLTRAGHWATSDAAFWLDVYTPWYWSAMDGVEQSFPPNAARVYGFDVLGSRMLDTWWHTGAPKKRSTQSLRCYSPADLDLLLEETPWTCTDCIPGCGVDRKTKRFLPQAPMHQAMSYTAILKLRNST